MSRIGRSFVLVLIVLISAPLGAHAQNTYVIRRSNGATAPQVYVGRPSSGNIVPGTGRGRTEGAYGMSPQLQRELGIKRQQ